MSFGAIILAVVANMIIGVLWYSKLLFGDYIHTSDDLGRINRYTIPTEAMRTGDFSASSVPIFDPLTGDPATGAGRTQFPGNRIPAGIKCKARFAVK